MRKLLRGRIIHHVVVRPGDHRLGLALGCKPHLQRDVVKHRPRLLQVVEQRALPLRRGTAERLQRGLGDDPRRDRRGRGLGLERTQRLVFPRLDVARRPIVQQHVAKDHRVGLRHRHRAVGRGADDGAHLKLDVKALAGRKDRQIRIRRLELSPGTAHVGARHHDRGRPPVVADGNRQPVRRQRVLRPAEHRADIGGVMLAGVEIGVFRDGKGHQHLGPGHRNHVVDKRLRIRRILCQQVGDARPERCPRGGAQRHELRPVAVEEDLFLVLHLDEAVLLHPGDVEDHVADPDPTVRLPLVRAEAAVRQVVQGKFAVGGVRRLDPASLQRHAVSIRLVLPWTGGDPGVPRPEGAAGAAPPPSPISSRACRRTSSRGFPSSRCNRPAAAPPARRRR